MVEYVKWKYAFCLDNSECSFFSEDLKPSRWKFQIQAANLLVKTACGGQTLPSNDFSNLFLTMADKPRVVISPNSEVLSTADTLNSVPPGQSVSILKSLKLALLTGRICKFTRIVLFVASKVSVEKEDVQSLVRSLQAADVGLDIVVLAPKEELGAGTINFMESFMEDLNSRLDPGYSTQTGTSLGRVPSSLAYVQPSEQAQESWQQLECLLEALCRPAEGVPPGQASASVLRDDPASEQQQLQRRTPLLRHKSGVNGPNICRYESLDALAHLSIDGFMRPWLPSYSNAMKSRPFICVRQGGNDLWYLYVYSYPKWRTLVEVSAGKFSPAESAFAAASSSSDSIRLFGDTCEASGSGRVLANGSIPAAPTTLRPETRRGCLRLLQSSVNTNTFKFTWQEDNTSSRQSQNMFDLADQRRRQAVEEAEWEVKLATSSSFNFRIDSEKVGDSSVLYVETSSHRARPSTDKATDTSQQYSANRSYFWLQQQWSGTAGHGAAGLARHLNSLILSPPALPPEPELEEAMREEALHPVRIGPFPSALVRAILDNKIKTAQPKSHGGSNKRGLSADTSGSQSSQPKAAGGCMKTPVSLSSAKQGKKLAKASYSVPGVASSCSQLVNEHRVFDTPAASSGLVRSLSHSGVEIPRKSLDCSQHASSPANGSGSLFEAHVERVPPGLSAPGLERDSSGVGMCEPKPVHKVAKDRADNSHDESLLFELD